MKYMRRKFLVLTSVLLCAIIMNSYFINNIVTVQAATAPTAETKKKTLYVGGKEYKIKLKNLSSKAIILYQSSDEAVATVTAKGVVKPLAKGNVIITAFIRQHNEYYYVDIDITVKKPSITINELSGFVISDSNANNSFVIAGSIKEKIAFIGYSITLFAEIKGLREPSIEWSSSNKNVATIEAATGKVTAKSVGTTIITAKDKKTGTKASITIIVDKDAYNIILRKNESSKNKYIDSEDCMEISSSSDIYNIIYGLGVSRYYHDVSDEYRVSTIYNWITENIYYDEDYSVGITKTSPSNPESTVLNKYAVSEGYANLLTEMLRWVRIPCIKVIGKRWTEADGVPSYTNYVWNEIYLNGRWITVDIAKDSGNIYKNGVFNKGQATRNHYDIDIETLSKTYLIEYRESGMPNTLICSDKGYRYYVESGNVTIVGFESSIEKELKIPETLGGYTVSYISEKAFSRSHVSGGYELILPSTIKYIGLEAFYAQNITGKISIPKNVEHIGTYAFSYNRVSEFYVDPSNQYYCSMDGVLYDKQITTLYFYPTSSERTSFTVPKTTTTLACTSFARATNLQRLIVENEATWFSGYTFASCTLDIYAKTNSVIHYNLITFDYTPQKLTFKDIDQLNQYE